MSTESGRPLSRAELDRLVTFMAADLFLTGRDCEQLALRAGVWSALATDAALRQAWATVSVAMLQEGHA